MKIQNAGLDAVAEAIAELAANRLPLPVAARLHNAGRAVRAALVAREELRVALCEPYWPEGKRRCDAGDPGYEELMEKLGELWGQEVDVDLGPALNPEKIPETVEVRAEPTLRVLAVVGLWPAAAGAADIAPPEGRQPEGV